MLRKCLECCVCLQSYVCCRLSWVSQLPARSGWPVKEGDARGDGNFPCHQFWLFFPSYSFSFQSCNINFMFTIPLNFPNALFSLVPAFRYARFSIYRFSYCIHCLFSYIPFPWLTPALSSTTASPTLFISLLRDVLHPDVTTS